MAYPASTVVNFKPISDVVGLQPIATTSTTQNHPLGLIVKAQDFGTAACGVGEFMYCTGVASTAAGDACILDPKAGTTARAVHSTAARGLLGVAMSDNVASQYGWYAISGVVPVASGTVTAGAPAFLTSTAGTLDDAVVSTDAVDGCTVQSTVSAGFAYYVLERPSCNGGG